MAKHLRRHLNYNILYVIMVFRPKALIVAQLFEDNDR